MWVKILGENVGENKQKKEGQAKVTWP